MERIAEVPMFATFCSKLSTEKHASYELLTRKNRDPDIITGTLSLVKATRSVMFTLWFKLTSTFEGTSFQKLSLTDVSRILTWCNV